MPSSLTFESLVPACFGMTGRRMVNISRYVPMLTTSLCGPFYLEMFKAPAAKAGGPGFSLLPVGLY